MVHKMLTGWQESNVWFVDIAVEKCARQQCTVCQFMELVDQSQRQNENEQYFLSRQVGVQVGPPFVRLDLCAFVWQE